MEQDHSVRGYLYNQTIEELETLLHLYLHPQNYKSYGYAVHDILEVLSKRGYHLAVVKNESSDNCE